MVTRTIPQDLEAEEAVLGAMLLSGDAIGRAVDLIGAADFYRPAHGNIFGAIEALYRRGEKSDTVTVADELRQMGATLEDPSVLVSLMNFTPNFNQVGHYAQIVVRHSTARRLMGLASDVGDRIAAYADPYELVDELQAKLGQLDMPVTSDRQQALTLDEIVASSDRVAPWVIPGLIRVDWRLVIVAVEGSGKSTLFRQCGASTAQGVHPLRFNRIDPVRVLIVDLENPKDAISETGALLVNQLRREVGGTYQPDNLRVFMRPNGIDLRTRRDRSDLEREITIHRPDLVIIGPAYKMIRRRERESYEEAIEPVLRVFDDLRTRHRFGLMIEHHAPVAVGGAPRALRPFGGAPWMRWPEIGLTMAEEREPGRYVVGRFRGDRLKSDWPSELHRSDRAPGQVWPWEGVWR